MDETKRRIDNIIINGLMVTSNDEERYISQYFSRNRLEVVVREPLKEYILEELDPNIKALFYLESRDLKTCFKIFDPADEVYSCLDCQNNVNCVMCYDCFLCSEHVNHKHEHWKSTKMGLACDCGDTDLWRCNSTCSKHMKAETSFDVLPETFLKKFCNILTYLSELLEDICTGDFSVLDNHMEVILSSYLQLMDRTNQSNYLRKCWKYHTKCCKRY
ncbi:E3 ubiquitin-protein ligase UBR1 [Thelohanellus kitauei]|uniref:E3 ubiquitin-protein ligase n=1 Tax=Thelohanellus kitauei TaxID=669202 RepID=A0A0C2MHV4_THEKT|nr:E3 ubiquitin-protein ligase UBR1 [Thelohanellus kitauei]